MSTVKSSKHYVTLLTILLLSGCSMLNAEPLRGFNFLQSESVTLDRPGAVDSMRQMQQLGANTIIFVPFLRQGRVNSDEIGFSGAVTDKQLISAFKEAHALGLKVILKPQILVEGGWSGQIRFDTDANAKRWFARYRDLMLYYARIAQEHGAFAFVIGTEMDGIESSPEWIPLIAAVRQVYHGKLTYAAHGINGIHHFPAWHQLDAVSVTLYPSLGDEEAISFMHQRIEATLNSLDVASWPLKKPVWIMEVGLPSVQGGAQQPWEWMSLHNSYSRPDTQTQKTVISLWLKLLENHPVDGLFFWCWYSDPHAGGLKDVDYTVQNKPAAGVIRCYWTGICNQPVE